MIMNFLDELESKAHEHAYPYRNESSKESFVEGAKEGIRILLERINNTQRKENDKLSISIYTGPEWVEWIKKEIL
jgi:hypothetical protein